MLCHCDEELGTYYGILIVLVRRKVLVGNIEVNSLCRDSDRTYCADPFQKRKRDRVRECNGDKVRNEAE